MSIVFDLETAPHPLAASFIEPLHLDAVKAAGNLKDPAKVAADLEQRRAAAIADHATKLDRAALDFNLNRIVAIGWLDDTSDAAPIVRTCNTEQEEAEVLQQFWQAVGRSRLVGFCSRTFDVPTVIQRSRYLSVAHRRVDIGRYGRGDVVDLRDVLTFDDARQESLMPRSLKAFCRRFGIPVQDEIGGGDIPRLVAADDWPSVVAHVTSDVELTAALARRLGVSSAEPVGAF